MAFLSLHSSKALQQEGVYIGSWSLRNVFTPKRVGGVHDSAEDRVQNNAVAVQDWTSAEERALVRKLDLRVLFPCCIIYFIAYLDRANLGNVRILRKDTPDSLEQSLHIHGTQFNWAVSISYFSVTALLIPSNLLMKKISAKYFFPMVMILWEIIVMSMASVTNAAELLAARFFLGVPESGVVPCCVLYFSFWYKPSERSFRLGVFHSANALASAMSGFLAIGLNNLNGHGGLKAWQFVFIVEGALPIVLALPVFFLLLTFPETSTALSDRERYIAINRFGRGSTRKTDVTWSWPAFRRIFSRLSTYIFFISYVSLCIVCVAQATFLPTILSSFLKFSVTKSNLYTAVCNLTIIPLYWVWPAHSDWTRERMYHYIFPVICSIPGYAVWTYASSRYPESGISNIALYGMAFLGQMVLISQPVVLSYRSSTLYGASEQAVGGAAAVASLSIASILGPQIYPAGDGPKYLQGFIATCAILAVCIMSYISLPMWLQWEALQRKKKTGHALPLQAMEDAESSQVSAATMARFREVNALEEAGYLSDGEAGKHAALHLERRS